MTGMADRTCSEPDCSQPHRARGLCSTHYNRLQSNRHVKITVPCDYCGEPCEKEPARSRSYRGRFCSDICRDLWRIETGINPAPPMCVGIRRGGRVTGLRTKIPSTHPARWFGACSPVEYRHCAWCDTVFATRPDSTRAYCRPRCVKRARAMRRRSREHAQSFGGWTWTEFMHVARRFGYCCAYCGERPDTLDPDHVVPIHRGGPNTVANLLPACRACNSDKRDLLLVEWADDRLRRGLPPRCTSWAAEDRRYHHLTSTLCPAA